MGTTGGSGSNDVTSEYLKKNEEYASTFHGPLPMPPSKHTAVVACMDARLDIYRILGLHEGDSHVIRNAGGVVTDDAIRSLVISQRLLGTNEIILIHHTDCGMLTFRDDELRASIQAETGFKPLYAFSKPTCVPESPGSRPIRTCFTGTGYAGSSSTSRRGGFAKCLQCEGS